MLLVELISFNYSIPQDVALHNGNLCDILAGLLAASLTKCGTDGIVIQWLVKMGQSYRLKIYICNILLKFTQNNYIILGYVVKNYKISKIWAENF